MAKKTKAELIAELLKCGEDPIYFIRSYAKIQHPTKGLLPFNLYPFQEDIIDAYTKHRKNIIVKARQLRRYYRYCCLCCLVHSLS
jgi:hypothetical protein